MVHGRARLEVGQRSWRLCCLVASVLSCGWRRQRRQCSGKSHIRAAWPFPFGCSYAARSSRSQLVHLVADFFPSWPARRPTSLEVGWFSAAPLLGGAPGRVSPFATAVGAMTLVEVLRRQICGKRSCQAHRVRREGRAMPLGWVATESLRHWRRGFMHVGERASNSRAGMCRESVPVASHNFFRRVVCSRGWVTVARPTDHRSPRGLIARRRGP